MTNTVTVNAAVRNGEENEAKRVARAATMPISQTASSAAASTRRRSSVAGAARSQAAVANAADHGSATKTRPCLTRSATAPSSARSAAVAAPTFHGVCPASSASVRRTTAASTATNAPTVSIVPRYLPTTYSHRRSGRERMGKIVLCSSSR